MILAVDAGTEGARDAISVLADAGVLGALVILLGLFALLAYRREVQRADRLEGELARYRDATEDRVIPLVERALATIEAARHERSISRSTDP